MKNLIILLLVIVTISSCITGSNEEPKATLIHGNSVPNSRTVKNVTYKDVTGLKANLKELSIAYDNLFYYYSDTANKPEHLDSVVIFLANKSVIKFNIEHGLN